MKIDSALAFRLLEGAMARGADLAEVYVRTSRNMTVEVRGRELDSMQSSVDFGYSIRVIRDKRLGFSFSNDAGDAISVAERAVEASRWTEQDDCLDLPGPAAHQPLQIFDPAVGALSEDEAVGKALAIEDAALNLDRRIKKVRKASASCSTAGVLIVNSKGLEKEYSSTACAAQITVVAEEGGEGRMGWDSDGGRFLEDIDFEAVGRKAASRALCLLGSKKIEATRAAVVLDNSVAVEFLGIFSSLLSSEFVQKGKSLLAGKKGERVISPLIAMVDDGLMARRLGSRPFDGEGVPAFRNNLIEEGVLRGYMYNVHSAKKEGVSSTGNAARAGFSSLPSVGPSILHIAASGATASEKDLPAMIGRCLYVVDAMGIHTANPVSGEFSIGVSGVWIENGEAKYPVKEAVISGNILDFFGRVKAVGDDVRFYGNMGSPSLLVDPVDISA